MLAGLETFNQQPCSPESCHSVTLPKVLLFVKAAPLLAKKVTAAISFSGPLNTSVFCIWACQGAIVHEDIDGVIVGNPTKMVVNPLEEFSAIKSSGPPQLR